jgi:hypothetical protein
LGIFVQWFSCFFEEKQAFSESAFKSFAYFLHCFSLVMHASWTIFAEQFKIRILKMSAFQIQWTPVQKDQLQSAKYAHFFAIVSNGKLVYIGLAHRQALEPLISETVEKHKLDHLGLKVFLGRVREWVGRPVEPTQLKATLELLVFAKKPLLNASHKLGYHSQAKLKLTNVGCEQMPARLRAEDQMVFVGA